MGKENKIINFKDRVFAINPDRFHDVDGEGNIRLDMIAFVQSGRSIIEYLESQNLPLHESKQMLEQYYSGKIRLLALKKSETQIQSLLQKLQTILRNEPMSFVKQVQIAVQIDEVKAEIGDALGFENRIDKRFGHKINEEFADIHYIEDRKQHARLVRAEKLELNQKPDPVRMKRWQQKVASLIKEFYRKDRKVVMAYVEDGDVESLFMTLDEFVHKVLDTQS